MWIEPKTDWKAVTDSKGNYQGDYFNAWDYNRIKNNMIFLYEAFNITPPRLGNDKEVLSDIFAREVNALEEALEYLRVHVADLDIGMMKEYFQNGRALTYDEVNRIESGQKKLYDYWAGGGS